MSFMMVPPWMLPMKLASAGCMRWVSTRLVSLPRGRGLVMAVLRSGAECGSDVEGAWSATLAPVAPGAVAAAVAVGAPLALAAVQDDLDVRVVPVVLDEAAVRLLRVRAARRSRS